MSFKKIYFLLLPIILLLLNSGCSSSNIAYDYDHTQIFSEYKTYNFVNHSGTILNGLSTKDSILYNKIKIAVNTELNKKGFAFSKNGKSDFKVLIHVRKAQNDGSNKFHPWWLPCGTTSVDKIDDNSLVIDIIDKWSSLTWRSLAPGFLKSYKKTKYLQKELDNVVSSILDGFPPN